MGKGFDSRKPKYKEYRAFLDKVLKTIKRTNCDRQAVERLLRANLDKLDDKFAQVLRNWAIVTLSNLKLEEAHDIAVDINNFSNQIKNFPLDNQAISREIAITGYDVAATVFTRQAFPFEWAMTQNNLGAAYFERIRGKKAENLEVAIRCYNAALEVRTRKAFPEQWADTQNNLGLVYLDRLQGEKAENLEVAISCFSSALQECTREAFSEQWADSQNNLGIAYCERIWGERAENLEVAIRCYKAALEIRTRKAFPEQWAETKNNLGNAYLDRIQGERAENLEAAIRCYSSALEVRICSAFPEKWAETKNNLGNAYSKRIQGERVENLEAAICCYKAALEVRTRKAFSSEWATTQNNLGTAYLYRIQEERAENLEAAIGCYEGALQEYTCEAIPERWALIHNNLGEAYRYRIWGKRPENLEAAIRCYNAALEVYTRKTFPQSWAMTQNNLGNAYLYSIQGKRSENLEVAIDCYEAALEVYTREAFPQNHAATQFNLGRAYHEAQQFRNAYNAYAAAIGIVESLRLEVLSGDEVKQKLAEEWNKLYQRMVEVCLEVGNFTEAVEYAERSKTRNLVELILTRDLRSIFPLEIVSQLEQLRDKIASGQYQLQTATGDNPTALAQHLQQLRQQRNELQDRYLPIGYGFNFEKFQETLDDYTAIIQWYITSTGFETFIITRYSLQRLILPTPANDLKALLDWANEYLDAYTQAKTQWINSLASRLSRVAEILHLEDILKLVPNTCTRLILIPHRYLHLFPLHALPLANGDFLCDRFPNGVGYAPSCQLLQLTQKRERPDFSNFFAIQNPTDDLLYTNLEVETIRSSFPSAQVLVKQAATKTALNASQDLPFAHCNHFSCHGEFNLTSPLESALLLANKERLTLGEIFGLNLNQCRLVTLSACETGLSDPTSISDEYISLPSGFLYAGSPSIVSSLWTVNDLSTAFLMLKFYKNFQSSRKQAGDVASALNQAQQWLRNLTIEKLDQFLNEHKPQLDQVLAQLRPGQRLIFQESLRQIRQRQPLPFANPYYWAAFTATGL